MFHSITYFPYYYYNQYTKLLLIVQSDHYASTTIQLRYWKDLIINPQSIVYGILKQ